MKPWVAVVLALGACTAEPPAPPGSAVTFHPDPGGLEVRPTGLRVDFGRAPAGVIAALDRELGPHRALGRELDRASCPAEVVQQLRWGDLVLSFSEHRFIGWRQGDAWAGLVCAGADGTRAGD